MGAEHTARYPTRWRETPLLLSESAPTPAPRRRDGGTRRHLVRHQPGRVHLVGGAPPDPGPVTGGLAAVGHLEDGVFVKGSGRDQRGPRCDGDRAHADMGRSSLLLPLSVQHRVHRPVGEGTVELDGHEGIFRHARGLVG